ncbi:proline-rich receptor-like protein kinase PERK3 isoform X2 [Cornus florida]|uniref:proline-rich receptor-like protein kinase PERK3 isoform X2 n=1 Tax=Cornus florida TaxID=4283 RepID=UPI00289E14E1|nr:proline-rich receptor-like protein kinase PERK3 isoform X2 [Cornus florida]
MNPFIVNPRDQLWFASSGSMAQMPWPGEIVCYFPKGHAQHIGAEFLDADHTLGMYSTYRVSETALLADPVTNEPFGKITLVACNVDPSHLQGNSNTRRCHFVGNPVSFKILTKSDVNKSFAVLKHCVNTIFPPLDSFEEQIIPANDIHGKRWDFQHMFKASQRQDTLRGEWRKFVKEKNPKIGDSIVFMRDETDRNYRILVGIVKKTSSITPEVSIAESRVPLGLEVTYYPRAVGPQFCVGVSDVFPALKFSWQAGMLFRKAFEMEDAAGINWFHGTVTSVCREDPWNHLKVQWDHSDRNEKFVNPWTVEYIPPSLSRQPPGTPQGPFGPQGPYSQNSGSVVGSEFFPKHQILQDKLGHAVSAQRLVSSLGDAANEAAHCFTVSEIEDATSNFEKKVGSGGFGVVYYGKLKDGKEIVVKVLTSNSFQGKQEFLNEVSLLSRIHHRNLVQFLGFCQEEGKSILVYEFMHNGTLKEHLYGPLTRERSINWIKRLEIAEDAAKGIEYLHTGCVPSIIHGDLKTSNIVLDKNLRAKVSDFGLSKLAVDGASHVSSIVRGTVGYLDPEYYISQQLTEKSDVYGFGVILLELISGHEAISNESFGVNCRNIVQWAKLHIESGDIQGIVDPCLCLEYNDLTMWKIAKKALMCVHPHGHMRPSISEVIKEIEVAIIIERGAEAVREGSSDDISRHSMLSSQNIASPMNIDASEHPTARQFF